MRLSALLRGLLVPSRRTNRIAGRDHCPNWQPMGFMGRDLWWFGNSIVGLSKNPNTISSCPGRLTSSSTPLERGSGSGLEKSPSSSIIPSQIYCTIIKPGKCIWLVLKAGGDHSQTMARFLSQLQHITKQLLTATTDGRTLRELNLICDLDRRDLQRWNQQPPSTVFSTIHELFRQRALESPQSQAVESCDGALSYAELDNLSSRLSLQLLEAGACLGDCIPLCFEKSLWTVVAILGVLKIGCSFLLMDVSHPTIRLQTLSNQAKATMVLSSFTQRQRAVELAPQVVVVSELSLRDAKENTAHRIEVNPSAVAAVVFTSGTTGTPKGIQIEHYSICSSLLALAKLAGVSNRTRYYQFSSYAFDAGFGEILMTLTSGGCVCIPSDGDRLNNLAKSICAYNADTVLLTPTVVRLLSPSDVPCLTTLISGGERVTQDIVELWGGILNLIIVYGPAETTVACVAKKATPPFDSATRVGFPLNSRIWIALLDNPNKLAPVGAIGEIVVEGPGIARSYINNRSDSAKLFYDATPWAKDWDSGMELMGRCYRTGDLAHFADDGEIIFIGRRDRQVKLRGQRIELEDVEFKLQQQNQLYGAQIVLELINIHSSDGLVAFLYDPSLKDIPGSALEGGIARMTEEMELEIERLRVLISEELPAYMWPVVWIPLKELPLGPTGKLDRRMLLRLGKEFCSNMQPGGGDEDGLLPTESILAELWRQILEFPVPNLKSDAHFFRLGGDSLRSMKLVTLASRNGYHLTMEKIFRNPTISAMTTAMQELCDNDSLMSVVPASNSHTQEESSEFWSLLKDYGLYREQVAAILPCTALQEGLFSLSLALPSLYSSQFVFEFSSAVNIEQFKVAWTSAIEAYPILRTAIVPSSSNLVQVVLQHGAAWTEVKQDLASFLSADKAVAFDPGQPLARFHHVRGLSSNQSHFVWSLHHAIFDGWSLEYVVEHIRHEYYHHSRSVQSPGSFKEFVRFCEGLDQDKARLFWTEQLMYAPTPSLPNLTKSGHLPADSSSLRHTIAAPTEATLGVTPTVLARATWALLLSEYEGSNDITFGNSLHGRNSLPHHLQDVVGPTVTTLPIRIRIDRAQTILGFLDDLQEQFSAMIPYEQFGLSRILAMNQEIKNAASIRTLLIVQVSSTTPLREEGLRLEEIERSLHEYPLVLTLVPEGSRTEIIATFDSAVILPYQIRRILQQFEQTFYQICSVPPDTKVGDLDLASEADKSILFRWNARHHKAFEVCVNDLIHEQVKRSPTSPAICSNYGNLDYAALDSLSDRLVGKIRRLGVDPGSVVGVLFEKSHWAIVSILAVIKAGSAFAPLSPTNPRKRLENIAREADINVVLCSPTQKNLFPDPPWQTIVVTSDTVNSFRPVAKARNNFTNPDSLLYVLSTSGTTGTPKVFAVQHKSFATGAIARASLIKRGSESRVLQFAPYVFDPSVEDILTTLMFGGCICVPSDEDIVGDISAYMKTAHVNFANLTPSVAHTLRQDELPELQILLLSGEAPDQALIDKWNGRVQLMNGYGPSECSAKCSVNCHLSRNDPRNIGHSVGTSLWVVKLTNHNCLTPLGAVGELVIESPNLARGYLNRAATTEDKFIASPRWLRDFRDGHEDIVYKTGDLVRYLEDGSIVYIGRADQQLKLHGQRLEGEEVRQRIQECLYNEQLQVIVDVARFQGQSSDVLIAYLAREAAHRAATVAIDPVLQQHLMAMKESIVTQLGSVLPKYMIPSVFLAITNIPVTANGKVYRRMLRAQTLKQRLEPQMLSSCDNSVQDPVSEFEKIQHRLWEKLLGLDGKQFGANAHFFDLGGSSLMAIKLAAAVRDVGYHLPAHHIFKHPILSTMAAKMTPLKHTIKAGPAKFSLLWKIGRSVSELWDCLAAYNINEQDIEDAYPCTRMQKTHTEEEMIAPGGNTFRHIVPLPVGTDLIRLTGALESVIKMNALLRTRYVLLSSDLVQIVLENDSIEPKVEFATPLGFQHQTVSWGLGQPQSRFSIIDTGGSQPRYLCRRMLLEDIDYAYHHNDVPPPRPQYRNFIEYVYDLKTEKTREMLAKEVEDIKFFNYFTFDGTRIPQVTHRLSLGIGFSATLPSGMSYATVMLTVWVIVAAHVEGHNHFLFNLMFGGRDAEFTGIDSLMGPTITTAPVAININNDSTIRRNVEIVHKGVEEAAGMQHSPELGDKLHQLAASAPLIVVNPPDDYVEIPTRHLGLVRSHAEIRPSADALVMNFCLHTGNAGVDLLAEIDPAFFPEDKAIRYFGYLEQVFLHVFSPGGLDTTVADITLGSGIPTKPVSISTDQTWGTSTIGRSAPSPSGVAVSS
ncbi:putative nonribosomal peptide synthase [Ampelomyces quisqualis]|uniref:Putative nonribosomal peptide synthase n=1 Tax=Ampelomyces quisqualis TaxID=50730 RepID=A0A6A5QIL4_AMPQU|nr:putative nonribosomal peptide synthase [Ampelomyces quisqualis]